MVPTVLSVLSISVGYSNNLDCAIDPVQTTADLFHWHFHVSKGEVVYLLMGVSIL